MSAVAGYDRPMRDLSREARRARRELVERLWAEGVDTAEIARQAGWSTNSPPSTYIAHYRAQGWRLPVRDVKRSESIRAAHRARC